MNVLVLGAGVIGVTSAWYLSKSRARSDASSTATTPPAGNLVRQRRPDLGVARRAVGESARAAQDPAAGSGARIRRSSSGCAPICAQWLLGARASCANAARAHAPQHPPARDARPLQPREPAGAARRDRHPVRPALRAASCTSTRASARSMPPRIEPARVMREQGCDIEMVSAAALRRDRAGARRVCRSSAAARRRQTNRATRTSSPRARAARRGSRREIPRGDIVSPCAPKAAASRGVRIDGLTRKSLQRRCLCRLPRLLQPAAHAAARHPPRHLSAKGYSVTLPVADARKRVQRVAHRR